MFSRGPKPKRFDYTPTHYNEEKEEETGRSNIRFKTVMTKKAGKASMLRLFLVFFAAAVAYIYVNYYFK